MIRWIFIFCAMIGCNDYNLTHETENPDPVVEIPEIVVDPLEYSFGALNSGIETQDAVVTIENIGNGSLTIDDIYLHDGNSNFSLISIPYGNVSPESSVDIIVSYSPGTYETNSDVISILSNDEDEPDVQVALDGSGDSPVISISPDYHDFGTVYLGCGSDLEVTAENIGNLDLIISDINYFVSLPVDFSLSDFENSYGHLPITVSPGGIISLNVGYTPLDIFDDSAYIEIVSNDPLSPSSYAGQDGLGDYEAWVTDSFIQDGDVSVDILFVVDNSGSMSGNQSNLKDNFDDFMAVFTVASIDYHVAVITTDSDSFVSDIITSASSDPVGDFNDQIDEIGYRGSATEKGLLYSYNATLPGGDASSGSSTGFFRELSKLVIVYISDEADSSSYSSTMTTSDYSSHLLSLKTSPDMVIAHAVAGDYPSGCTANGGAQFGNGYYDVVNDLGGTFMSICADDWSVTMDTLARESLAEILFTLSADPIEDTIDVSIDGSIGTDWSYDRSINSIVFGSPPGENSVIDITYAVWAVCE